jgi:hypothetical protein
MSTLLMGDRLRAIYRRQFALGHTDIVGLLEYAWRATVAVEDCFAGPYSPLAYQKTRSCIYSPKSIAWQAKHTPPLPCSDCGLCRRRGFFIWPVKSVFPSFRETKYFSYRKHYVGLCVVSNELLWRIAVLREYPRYRCGINCFLPPLSRDPPPFIYTRRSLPPALRAGQAGHGRPCKSK